MPDADAHRRPILLVTPLESERAAVLRAIRKRHRHSLVVDSRHRELQHPRFGRVIVRCCGCGPAVVRDRLPGLIRSAQPAQLWLAGCAGALDPSLRRGEAREVTRWSRDTPAVEQGAIAILTVDRPLLDPAEKRRQYQLTAADMVDTETATAAGIASELGLRFRAWRAVSDTADEALPIEVTKWVDEAGRTRLLRVLRDLAWKPRLVPVASRLAKASQAGAEGIADQLIAAWTGASTGNIPVETHAAGAEPDQPDAITR